MKKSYSLENQLLADYVNNLLSPEDSKLAWARENSLKNGLPTIQVSAFDARHLEVLSLLCRPINAIEIGTLGGYSAIAIARGLQTGGKLYTLEVDSKHARVAG